MKQAILEKINKEIVNSVKTEPQTYYILAQCRKLMETHFQRRPNWEARFPTISLCGDWILHSKLTGPGAIKKLEEYANFFDKYRNTNDANFEFMKGFTLFKDLKSELMEFSGEVGLNAKLTQDKTLWKSFVRHLSKILKDLPLRGQGVIKEFKFDDGFMVDDREVISFSILFSNGRNGHFTVDEDLISG